MIKCFRSLSFDHKANIAINMELPPRCCLKCNSSLTPTPRLEVSPVSPVSHDRAEKLLVVRIYINNTTLLNINVVYIYMSRLTGDLSSFICQSYSLLV